MEQSEDDYHQQEGKLTIHQLQNMYRLNVVLTLSLSILSFLHLSVLQIKLLNYIRPVFAVLYLDCQLLQVRKW